MISISSKNLSRTCLLFLLILFFGLFSPSIYADGGAPQLSYVAGTAQGISIINIAQRRVTGAVALASSPHTVLLSPDGSALYVTLPVAGQLVVIATKTGKALCTAKLPGQPSLLALSLDSTVLYVAGQGDTSVRAVNPRTCAVQRSFETHEPVYGLAVAASTAADATPSTPNQLWVTGSNTLTVFDVQGHQLGAVAIPDGPEHICIPGGFTAYVTTRKGTIIAVDLNSRKVFRTLLSGGQFGSMDYDAYTGEVYVPDQRSNQLDVLTPVAMSTSVVPKESVRVLHLSSAPQAVAITSNGQLGFVALSDGRVLMLDVPGRSIITSIVVGGTPQFIITGLYPPAAAQSPVPSSPPIATSPSLSGILLIILAVLVVIVVPGLLWLFWRYRRKRI